MERNDVWFTRDTISLKYYDFQMTIKRLFFVWSGINDFKKCMRTIKWACSDDPDKFIAIIACINTTISVIYPDITAGYDKKQKVLDKYRKEYLNYEL